MISARGAFRAGRRIVDRCPLGLRPDSCATNCAQLLANTLRDTHGGVPKRAAIIVELVQGEGGSIPAPADFVRRVAAVDADAGAGVAEADFEMSA